MRVSRIVGAVAITTLVGACSSDKPAKFGTFADSASYAIGMDMGRSVTEVKDKLSFELLVAGVRDMGPGKTPALSEQDAQRVIQAFIMQMRQAQQQNMSGAASENQKAGDEYRAQNAKRTGVQTTATGLQYEVLRAGSGPKPKATDRVKVHYKGTLIDGTEFDGSYSRGEPVTFALNQVISGWTEGVQLMNVGSKFRFVVPPALAYGESGGPGGPNSTLIFEVELLGIEQ